MLQTQRCFIYSLYIKHSITARDKKRWTQLEIPESPGVQVSPAVLYLLSFYKALNPRPPLPWWSSKDSLLIEHRCSSSICALSAGETSSPFSNELQTAAQDTFSVSAGCAAAYTLRVRRPQSQIWVYFPGDKDCGYAVRKARAVLWNIATRTFVSHRCRQISSDGLSDCTSVAAVRVASLRHSEGQVSRCAYKGIPFQVQMYFGCHLDFF